MTQVKLVLRDELSSDRSIVSGINQEALPKRHRSQGSGEISIAIGSTALAHFLIILVIGIVVGLAFSRYARSWLASLGITTRGDFTSALVGIAGAFMGFHLGVILGLLPSPLMLYFGAVAGAFVVLWVWRGR